MTSWNKRFKEHFYETTLHSGTNRQCCLEYQNGKSVSLLVQELHIPRSTVYAWLKRFREETQANKKEISLKTYHLLENKVTRMENIIQVLQSVSCTVNDPLEFKLEALERLYGQYSVHVLCDALKVPRGTFYNYLLRNKRDNTWYAKRQEELRSKIHKSMTTIIKSLVPLKLLPF